ncbi:hypothetical protein S40293_11103 [Stachybotrys chartarum IBT 40293]|nr:hypothetical protein S40293_11103 [Stachybotrys chartarum IBT 40293]
MELTDIPMNWKSHGFRACAPIITTDTTARIWSSGEPHTYNVVLNDLALRKRLQDLASFWDNAASDAENPTPKLVIL